MNTKTDYTSNAALVLQNIAVFASGRPVVIRRSDLEKFVSNMFNGNQFDGLVNFDDFSTDKVIAKTMGMVRAAVKNGRALHIGKGYYDVTPLIADINYNQMSAWADTMRAFGRPLAANDIAELERLHTEMLSIPSFEIVKRIRQTA